ncbi:MAG: hypothetical protein HYZ34_15055, partial [Ignavibacteriae bacterium]|nr:hypothetical protein [Ignavibacteriota bacterium]
MKIFTLILVTLFAFSLVYADNVEFRVNMKIKALKGTFNPTTGTVNVRGSLNGWGETAMSDGDNDSIYTVTVDIPATTAVEFKFHYNPGDNWENVANRQYTVPGGGGSYEDYFDKDSFYVPTYSITVNFSCNMELERLSGRFDPNTDGVSVNGSFNGWASMTTILTANPLNPDIYEGSATVLKAVGENIEFKYWYQDNNWESVSNRVYVFTQTDADAGEVFLEHAFNDGTLETVLNQPCTVKFKVYMTGAKSAFSGNPFPMVNTVHIAGSALPLKWPGGGWPDGDITNVIQLFDDGTNGDETAADGWYSKDTVFPSYTILAVQFKYGANWGDVVNNEGGNDNEAGFAQNHNLNFTRYMTQVTVSDTFGKMGNSVLSNAKYAYTFNVDMSIKALKGIFDPTADLVYVRGGFNGWGTGNPMTDADDDSVYTATLDVAAGTFEFKFMFQDISLATEVWESNPNRSITNVDGGSFTDFFDRDDCPPTVAKNVDLVFSCNMELERLSGRFNPSTHVVSVNGNFNGWSPMTTVMTPNPLNPDIYEAVFPRMSMLCDVIEFKFWYQ